MRRLLLLAVVASVACSGTERTNNITPPTSTGASGTGEAAALSAKMWCESVIGSLTGYYARCYGGTAAEWRAAIDGLDCDEIVEDVRQARRSFDAAKGSACNTAVMTASCGRNGLDIDSCETAFVGAVAAGESCSDSSNCVDGTECVIPPLSCTGSCTIEMRVGVDQPCTDARCDTGLICQFDSTGAPPVCKAFGNLGASCTSTFDCAEPLWCDGTTCAAGKPAGGACDGGYRECSDELVCAGPNGGRACRVPKKIGESCTAGDRECVIGHCSSGGVCVFGPSTGQMCGMDGLEEAECLSGYCTSETGGICQERKSAGVACVSAGECASFECTEGVCQAPQCP